MYNKLFTKILDSSIWLESTPTRIVWLTFIAVMDEAGFAQFASVANVAHRARVTLDEAQEAVQKLENPDPDSSDPENAGRRLERVPGGWMVLNAEKHRVLVTRAVIQEQTRERVRRFRDRLKSDVTLSNASPFSVTPSEAEAVADTKARSDTKAEKQKKSGNGSVNSRSRRPIFQGQRFVVFDWMLEDMSRTLGNNTEDFDLHTWFFDLDARIAATDVVLPKSEQWPWLQAELIGEARKRGLPIAVATEAPTAGKLSTRLAGVIAKIAQEG